MGTIKEAGVIKDIYDVIVVGGGPAGLAAALSAWENGAKDILVCERDEWLGGILNQCIHNGFGLHYFREELTGPEYAGKFEDLLENTGVEVLLNTMVLALDHEPDAPGREAVLHKHEQDAAAAADKISGQGGLPDIQPLPGLNSPELHDIYIVSRSLGYRKLRARSVVLAMGCRERSRGAIGIPGTRPAGVMTAGTAQRYVNIEGYMPGRRVVILGSGDIGLIMARRMSLEGAEVLACVELLPYSGGLRRNIVQCLEDFDIPLLLSHTVTEIRGRSRVEQVVVSRVDEERRPIPGTETVYDCDTLLLSVGLLPENELTREARIPLDPRTRGAYVYENMETSTPGVFACGNVVHVHDLVDFVSQESARAGAAAAAHALGGGRKGPAFAIHHDEQISYTVPQNIHQEEHGDSVDIFFRVKAPLNNVDIEVWAGDSLLRRWPRLRVAPGEMEKITLNKVLLGRISGDYLTLAISRRDADGSAPGTQEMEI